MRADNLFNVFILLVICCGPPTVLAVLGGVVYARFFWPRAQLKKLAEALGWKLDTRYPAPYHGYFGTHQDRTAEIAVGARHTGRGGRYAARWTPAFMITLQLQPRSPRRFDAHAYHQSIGPQDNFDSVFRQYHSEPLSVEAQAALLKFARKHVDLSLVSFPPASGSPTPPPVTKMELQHTTDRVGGVTAAQVRAVLDDLNEVALIIETTC